MKKILVLLSAAYLIMVSGITSAAFYAVFSSNKDTALDTTQFFSTVGDDYTPGCIISGDTQGHYLEQIPDTIGADNFYHSGSYEDICLPVTTDESKIVTAVEYSTITSTNSCDASVQVTLKDADNTTYNVTYYKGLYLGCSAIGKTMSCNYDATTAPGAFTYDCV